jgi:hypothetical protein
MKSKVLKILSVLSLLAATVAIVQAQYATAFTVTDIQNNAVSKKIDAGASALLTEFNMAFVENRAPSLGRISGLKAQGKTDILAMWEIEAFRCIETEIIERGLSTSSGYQVRNIPMALKNLPGDEVRNIAINFDRAGNIEDVYFTLEHHNYKEVVGEGNEVADLRRRQAILNFVENFRTAYNRKDLELLAKVYSDHALIITGKVVKSPDNQSGDIPTTLKKLGFSKEIIQYQVFSKKEYIERLRGIFKANTRINIVFDSISVTQHPKYSDIYGVTLKQGWNTSQYSDVGYLLLVIDFRDGEDMQVHVRTWQPDKLNGRPLSKDEIFKLGDLIFN